MTERMVFKDILKNKVTEKYNQIKNFTSFEYHQDMSKCWHSYLCNINRINIMGSENLIALLIDLNIIESIHEQDPSETFEYVLQVV